MKHVEAKFFPKLLDFWPKQHLIHQVRLPTLFRIFRTGETSEMKAFCHSWRDKVGIEERDDNDHIKSAFQKCFEGLRKHCQKCILFKGNGFVGNKMDIDE